MSRSSVESIKGRRQFLENYRVELTEWAPPVSVAFLVVLIFLTAMLQYSMGYMGSRYTATRDNLTEALQSISPTVETEPAAEKPGSLNELNAEYASTDVEPEQTAEINKKIAHNYAMYASWYSE